MRTNMKTEPQQYAAYPGGTRPAAVAEEGPQIRGWTAFGGVMLLVAGAFGAINGLIALLNSDVYVATEDKVVLLNFTQWGWIHLIAGGVVALVGLVVILTGALWARVLGVAVAVLHAFAQVAFIEAYPFWTLATIALDVAVIYGLLQAPQPGRSTSSG